MCVKEGGGGRATDRARTTELIYVCTRSHVLDCTEQKWGCGRVPERHILTGGWPAVMWSSSFDNRSNREREEEGWGWSRGVVRVSDSGIRQLVQAAWLEADLIVHLSLLQHPTCFCSTFPAFLKEDRHHSFVFVFQNLDFS